MDRPEVKERRLALRHDPGICAALDAWWDATDSDGNGAIDRDEYASCQIASCLRACLCHLVAKDAQRGMVGVRMPCIRELPQVH